MQIGKKTKNTFFWIVSLLILALTITLGVLNWTITKIHFIFFEVQGRLIFILLIFFLLGFFLGKLSHFIKNTQDSSMQKNMNTSDTDERKKLDQ